MPRQVERIPARHEVDDDTALLLDVAARLAFPDGSVSGLVLRRAASRDELQTERLGGRVYTTLAWIREWRTRCRQKPRGLDCGSSRGTAALTAGDDRAPGQLRTTTASVSARASAEAALADLRQKLKKPSPATSSRGGKSPESATVVPMRSMSRT
jgi:hypothetical protein